MGLIPTYQLLKKKSKSFIDKNGPHKLTYTYEFEKRSEDFLHIHRMDELIHCEFNPAFRVENLHMNRTTIQWRLNSGIFAWISIYED